jgi:hypothetical protein
LKQMRIEVKCKMCWAFEVLLDLNFKREDLNQLGLLLKIRKQLLM